MRTIFFLIVMVVCSCVAQGQHVDAQAYDMVSDILYTSKTDSLSLERLRLDVYFPTNSLADRPVVVWFHGGGLEGGQKAIPEPLQGKGYVVVAVEYRLLPQVDVSAILDDAAEALYWVMRNIDAYGGDTRKMVVSGHSAGGYIALMLCLNKSWLAKYAVDADDVMLYAPLSGQAITHYNVRKAQGIPPLQPTIDEFAPLYWVRGDCPPLLLICGDRELELYGRYDENQYLARMMKLVGHKSTRLVELPGYDHNGMVSPAFDVLNAEINEMMQAKKLLNNENVVKLRN